MVICTLRDYSSVSLLIFILCSFFFLLSLSLACFLEIKELSVLRVNEAKLVLASSFMQHYLALITI